MSSTRVGLRDRRRSGGGRRVWRLAGVAAASGAMVATASGVAGAATSNGTSGTLHVAVVAPFTGVTANFGVLLSFPCKAATSLINKAGGVMGKTLGCQPVNNYGDPADAVPSLQKAFATSKTIVVAEGFDSTTAATTIPLVERQKIPFITTNGLTSYDSQKNKYFYRMSPSDEQNGAAYSVAADHLHFKKVAIIYANNIGASGNIPGTNAAAKKVNLQVTSNLVIPGDETSYSSTVERVVAGKPQALIFYADSQTTATFLANYSQLTNGKLPPIVTAESNILPTFVSALGKVAPVSYITKKIYFVGQTMTQKQPAFTNFSAAMKAVGAPGGAINGVVSSIFTGLNILSLAMDEAHSTKGTVYNKDVLKVVAAHKGSVVVHTYKEGLAALKKHKSIQYVGTGGPIKFDSAHNFVGSWGVSNINATGTPNQVFTIPGTKVLADATGGHHSKGR
ncbi:MAG: ABC transporter substrate-binding protein [Acidimicrobiales bacterium]